MPSVSEELCHDLVEPALKPSINNTIKSKQSKKSVKTVSNYNARPSRTIYVEKKRVVSKIAPSDGKKPIAKTLKSKETILKKHLIDMAVNTLVTGPLRCDNYCVTMVQKRDPNAACKCAIAKQKVKPKASSKIIQTLYRNSFIHMDKACDFNIDKINCGTQFLEKKNSILKPSLKKTSKTRANINFVIPKDSFGTDHGTSKSVRTYEHKYNRKYSEASYHNITTHCLAGKRWALSSYPRRGPDF